MFWDILERLEPIAKAVVKVLGWAVVVYMVAWGLSIDNWDIVAFGGFLALGWFWSL